jgi:hypothetical protein
VSKKRDDHPGQPHERRPAEAEAAAGKGPTGTPPPAANRDEATPARPPLKLRIIPLDGRDTLKYEDVADK